MNPSYTLTQIRRLSLFALLTAASLPLAACSQFSVQIETPLPTPGITLATVTMVAATEVSAAATETPIATVMPTPEVEGVLPAPLYFIAAADEQLWRVERDGQTLTQITHEGESLKDFDVSLFDGALAYVVGNDLVRTDANGNARTVLVSGPALPGADTDLITSAIRHPHWSPDGQWVAYGLNGVNLVAASGGTPQMLIPSDPIPQTRAVARFYRPYAWSPDGSRLLIQYGFWMEGGGYLIRNMADGTVVDLGSEVCCLPVWSTAGEWAYFWGGGVEGYNAPGLWQVDAMTGAITALIAPSESQFTASPSLTLVRAPHAQADGQLLVWLKQITRDAEGFRDDRAFQLFRVDPADIHNPTLLRPETHIFSRSAWASDGSGIVILEQAANANPAIEHFVWLPTAGSAALTLPGAVTTDYHINTPFKWGR